MEENKNEGLDSQNQDDLTSDLDSLDESALRERNRHLYARTKKSEGELKELKDKYAGLEKELTKLKSPPEEKKRARSDDELLMRLDNMALKMAGIEADDEKELFERWKKETGRDADSIIGNKIFQGELADLRTSKANAAATANIEGDGKDSGAKNDPDYWIAKATKGADGKLMFPDNLPNDFKLRAAIIEKIGASTKQNKQFYNS